MKKGLLLPRKEVIWKKGTPLSAKLPINHLILLMRSQTPTIIGNLLLIWNQYQTRII